MTAIPRCEHGNIILGCPLDECADQNAYVAEAQAQWDRSKRPEIAEKARREMGR